MSWCVVCVLSEVDGEERIGSRTGHLLYHSGGGSPPILVLTSTRKGCVRMRLVNYPFQLQPLNCLFQHSRSFPSDSSARFSRPWTLQTLLEYAPSGRFGFGTLLASLDASSEADAGTTVYRRLHPSAELHAGPIQPSCSGPARRQDKSR